MRFKDVFSIIGPSMIGPSSSHTAGAVRIGRVVRQLLGELPDRAEVTFFGSFAETYVGHGTDAAVVGGLLDMETDDPRIVRSLGIAREAGMHVAFHAGCGAMPHPNTAVVKAEKAGETVSVTGCSIGGGNIEIVKVGEFSVKFTGTYPTLALCHADRPGMLAEVTKHLFRSGLNIGYMSVDRKARSGEAMTVIEADLPAPDMLLRKLSRIEGMKQVKSIELTRRNRP